MNRPLCGRTALVVVAATIFLLAGCRSSDSAKSREEQPTVLLLQIW